MNRSWIVAAALTLPLTAFADTANVQKASSVLDFDPPKRAPAAHGGADGFPGALDLDGDGQVSKAEAAGNAEVTLGFDRADRNRNGRISAAEWTRYEKWREQRAKAREARLARAKQRESAAAGGTAPKRPKAGAP